MRKEEKIEVLEEEKKPVDKSVILPEEVDIAVKGDDKALLEQMERVKLVNKEDQLKMIEEAKRQAALKEQRAKEAELKKVQDEQKRQEYLKQQQLLEQQRKNEEIIRAQQEAKKKQEEALLEQKIKQEEEQKRIQMEELAKKQAIEKQQKQMQQKQQLEQQKAEESKNLPKDETSNFKRVMAFIFFIGMFAMVYFLPDITKFINDYKASRAPQEEITTGTTTCTLDKSNENLNTNITAKFSFVNKKLLKLTYTIVSSGEKYKDSDELKKLNDECINLKDYVGELEGVTISCSLNNEKNTNKQILDYEKIDVKTVTSAYTEAGGVYPEFNKGDDIGKIESKMTSAKYKCNRE